MYNKSSDLPDRRYTYCLSCAKRKNFDFNHRSIVRDKNGKKYPLCYNCDYKYFLIARYGFVNISWLIIIHKNIKNNNNNYYYICNWIMSAIECGYINLKAEKASIIIQRNFRKYSNRKKNLRQYYLVANRLLKTRQLPRLPLEMYMMITKFI